MLDSPPLILISWQFFHSFVKNLNSSLKRKKCFSGTEQINKNVPLKKDVLINTFLLKNLKKLKIEINVQGGFLVRK